MSAGSGIDQSDTGIALLDTPDPDAARLFLIAAGNVGVRADVDYLDACDTELVEDPAQSWNALTVGAYTTLTACPSDVAFTGWSPMATTGELSPFSRTSVRFSGSWPIKPDICTEGGNVLTNGHDVSDTHSVCSLVTTSTGSDLTLATANATSAATAQAARLAGRALAVYPSFWPETIRGLLVHAADWTPAMRESIDAATRKKERSALLRRYGWGVPTDSGVLESTANAVTLVTQDRFIPFDDQHAARRFRLHRLPWPADELLNLVETPVQLRVTLSYFIEPNASHRGWRRRYVYPSHGFRFELKNSLESEKNFIDRINRAAKDEEETGKPSGGADRWFLGPQQRSSGSLHQDIWDGTGAELAGCGLLAVYPVGGWWMNNRRADRAELPLRYSLIVSLRTAATEVDLYTPIAAQIAIPVEGS